jgi:hypothetical protein
LSAHARNISSAVMQRLVYARLLLHDGLRTARNGRIGFQGLSILALHDCIEMVLLALVEHLHVPDIKERVAFDALVSAVRGATPNVPFPQATAITRLNKARIGFKHYGNIPADTDVEDFSKDAELFFDEVLLRYFSLRTEDISIASLVEHPRARRYLLCAERESIREQHGEAVEYAAMAFAAAFGEVRQPDSTSYFRHGDFSDQLMSPLHDFKKIHSKITELAQHLDRRLAGLEKRHIELDRFVQLMMAGIDIFRYAQFTHMAPNVTIRNNGPAFIDRPHSETKITKNDAQKVLQFVQDSLISCKALHIQPHTCYRDRRFITNALTKVYFETNREKGKYFCDLAQGTEVFALPENYDLSHSMIAIDLDGDRCIVDRDSLTAELRS